EVYNYTELRVELEKEGVKFATSTDTEVILQAYIKWGAACQNRFIGMWAFAILDKEEKTLFLSRDRFGIKPLYYATAKGSFSFSSEIKPLLETGMASRKVSKEKLAQYLSFGTLFEPRENLFSDISDFPPGHGGIVDLETCELKIDQYYHLPKESPSQSFDELVNDSIQFHLRSDVPVGCCLSGGLDSTAITTALQGKVTLVDTFTAAFPGSKVDEKRYVEMVEGDLKKHYCYPTSEGLLADVDQMIYHQELPIGSSSIFAQWSVMKLAAENGAKVLLDGQGADEIFGGYYNFAGIHVLELFRKWRFGAAKRAYGQLKENFTPNMKNATARAGYYFLPKGVQRALRKKTRLGMNFVHPKYSDLLKGIAIPERGGRTMREHAELSLQFGMYDLLRYEDRNSMVFSIESRVPFLDHRIVEHALNLDGSAKIVNGWTKYPIRKYLEGKQSDELVYRKDKIGFATPQQEWKNNLAKEMKSYFQGDMPEFFNQKYILEICEKDELSNAHLSEFFRLYSVLKWIEIFQVEIV
ncbi:MAG: asparagine synthase (glutamine-hydrolyzing), partial [Flavobacteriales bacterium]|nr:asparagine synthase (glutamine-hydrolyzing) [Flavobacteriales bacterium]